MPLPEPPRKPSRSASLWGMRKRISAGLALALLILLGGGAWLDSKLSTAPLLMIVGAFVGGVAGFYRLYYHIVIEPRERADRPQ